ncbi:hypothetical protein AKJ16_DCAP25925 [Drosera capensis]
MIDFTTPTLSFPSSGTLLTSTMSLFTLSQTLPFPFPFSSPKPYVSPHRPIIRCANRSPHRTGKRRYPSEKRRLRQIHTEKLNIDAKDKFEGTWRFLNVGVEVGEDPGKDWFRVSGALMERIAKVLEFPVASMLPEEAFTVVRKSLDARKKLKEPKFVYTVDMDVRKLLDLQPRAWEFISELKPVVGFVEHISDEKVSSDLINIIYECKADKEQKESDQGDVGSNGTLKELPYQKPRVAVVGSGPSGLFATLVLAELGADVTLIERGQPVEQRGRDIGALVVRRIIQSESNFCYGELSEILHIPKELNVWQGGAGTWSDGKLVTRIGKNSSGVQTVLKTLVRFGAPESILVDGKPHLGTDRLVPLLRSLRQHLQALGVSIKFGTRVDDLLVEGEVLKGVKVSNCTGDLVSEKHELGFDSTVLGVGHSARDVYEMLLSHNVELVPKDFAINMSPSLWTDQVGLRVEHPQELINRVQYSALAAEVRRGRGKLPVADYKVSKYVTGKSPSDAANYGCYSFCMCPGGQIVLTSTDPAELCINGMSFSRRSSNWANAAIVVTVSCKDFEALNFHGPLAGVTFQRELEKEAARMGGGNFVVPVQTVPDFLANKLSDGPLPTSSYRMGVNPSSLHELFPSHIRKALQDSIATFESELPGFISEAALLHGVETRTSSPVQIPRDVDTYESLSLKGLYPIGEGAGYAGGIVSAAVDGMYAGFALAKNLGLFTGSIESLLGKAQNSALVKY